MKTVMLSILLSIGLWAVSPSLFGKVINVAEDDTLNVHKQSNYKSKKVAELPPKAYIGIEKCKKIQKTTWCRVYPMVQQWYEKFGNDSHKGWVNARYLKFNNRGYVIIDGKKNCDYVLRCKESKCEVVDRYEQEKNYNVTSIKTKWIERDRLRGESNFGAISEDEDGFCNSRIFIEDYLKNNPNYFKNQDKEK